LLFLSYSEKNKTVFYRVKEPNHEQTESGHLDTPLQTPFSKLLKMNFEDENINTDELRLFFHGQEDHVRTFGEYQFLKSIEEVGFKLQIKKHDDYFNAQDTFYYGVPPKEDLIMVSK
jgi:hypothetical protein